MLAALAGGIAAACSPLEWLDVVDRLAPGGGGGRRVARDVAYGADERHKLDIYAPADAEGPLPVVLFFYGGYWRSGRRQDYRFVGSALAGLGYLAVIPDYRLVPAVRFPAFVEDGAAVLRWAARHAGAFGGDGGRLAIAGHSAGAYIALMLALDPRWLPAAGVEPAVLRAAIGLAGPYDFLPFPSWQAEAAFGNAPDPALTQPIRFSRADAPPVLLLTGDADDVIEAGNSVRLDAAIRAAGGRSRLRVYPGLGHADLIEVIATPYRGRAPVLADMADFLRAAFRSG